MFEELQTIAQIAIGLAGFASIATVLGKKQHKETVVFLQRLLVLLTLSISVMFLSFLPSILLEVGFDEARTWRFSAAMSASFAILLITPVSPVIRNLRKVRKVGYPRYQIYKDWTFYPYLIGIVVCLTVSFGFAPDISGAGFVFSLLTLLLPATVQFVRLIISILGDGSG